MADKENSSATDDASRDLYERGREAMSKGDLPLAISHFNESIRLSPHFKTLELLGECYLKQRQYQQALVPLGASVGLGSRPFRSLWLLARALEAVGERQDAIEKLIDALAMQPSYRTARRLLDDMYARRDRDRGRQPSEQTDEVLEIEHCIAEVQALYVQAFKLQTEIDNAYESAKLKIEKFTAKYGRAPKTEAKLGKLSGFPHVKSDL